MYKYKIGHSDWEEYECIELEHTEQFTQDQITQIIAEAVEYIYPLIADKNKDESGEYKYMHSRFDHIWNGDYGNTITLPAYLIKFKGFKEIQYEVNWTINSRSNVLKTYMSHCTESDNLNKIITYLEQKNIQ